MDIDKLTTEEIRLLLHKLSEKLEERIQSDNQKSITVYDKRHRDTQLILKPATLPDPGTQKPKNKKLQPPSKRPKLPNSQNRFEVLQIEDEYDESDAMSLEDFPSLTATQKSNPEEKPRKNCPNK